MTATMTPSSTWRSIARVARMARAIGVAGVIGVLSISACVDRESTQKMAQALQIGSTRPDEVPSVINADLPFRYPAALYARRIQGNVTLRLYVNVDGETHPDSTRIEESSGYGGLDSAAVKGASDLRFIPAKLRGDPTATTVLFPVYFRHPEATPLPGDTILTRSGPAAAPDSE